MHFGTKCANVAYVEHPDFLSPTDAAARVGVHKNTLKRWAREGRIKGYRSPGGWWLFRIEDLDAAIKPDSSSEPAA